MKFLLASGLTLLITLSASGQGSLTMSAKSGVSSRDLQSVLYFENISFEKFQFRAPELTGRNFSIHIREFRNGKVVKTDTAFNSSEDEYFRLKSDSLIVNVLTKVNEINQFKIEFQFNGFSASRKYQLTAAEKEKFTLKDFLAGKKEKSVSLTDRNYILAYMLPYVRKDKSEAYCEVAQSGTDPEKLYDKYAIAHYFLVDIKFY